MKRNKQITAASGKTLFAKIHLQKKKKKTTPQRWAKHGLQKYTSNNKKHGSVRQNTVCKKLKIPCNVGQNTVCKDIPPTTKNPQRWAKHCLQRYTSNNKKHLSLGQNTVCKDTPPTKKKYIKNINKSLQRWQQ